MDPTLIYRKTPEGEISISGRSRLREQRLRAVLILVDGETTVGRLCEQFGDKFRPQETIAQLEQLGLIELVAAPSDTPDGAADGLSQAGAESLDFESTKDVALPMPEIGTWAPPEPDAAPMPPEPESLPASEPESPESESLAAPEPESPSEPEPQYTPAPKPDTPPASDVAADLESPEAAESEHIDILAIPPATEDEPADMAPDALPEAAAITTDAESSRTEILPGDIREVPPARPPWTQQTLSRFSSLFEKRARVRRPRAAEPAGETQIEPNRRGGVRLASWQSWLGIILLGIIAAIGFVLFALPWNDYRQKLEAQASALTGQPVRVTAMRLELLPYPQVVLHDIAVGREPLARIPSARLTPSVHSLSDLRRLAVNVAIDGLTLEKRAVAAVCGATHLNAKTASQSHLRSVHIENMALVLPAGRITGLQAEIALSPESDRTLVTVTDSSDLRLELAPDAAGCSFNADGQRWTLPMSSGIVLSGLAARGSVDEGGIRVDRFDARSADGIVGGSGTLRWGHDARLDLRIELGHLSVEKALGAVGVPAVAHGELDGKLHLTALSPQLHELGHGLSGSGTIAVSRGAIDRFNVIEATRNPGKTAVYGGAFSFDRLTAQVQLNPQTTIVRNLSVNAGALQADGEIAFQKEGRLKGSLYANISSAGRRLRIPVTVAGSLASPELKAVISAQPETVAVEPHQSDNPVEGVDTH